MSYLDLAKQARARRLAGVMAPATPAVPLPPDELNEITKKPPRLHQANVTAVLRTAYDRWFTLTVAEADGAPVDPLEAQALHQQIVQLTDEAGPAWADAVYAAELRRFRWETGRCGLCGGPGHLREPE